MNYSKEKTKKVILINPQSSSEYSVLTDFEANAPPIGLLYIAAVLERNHTIKIIDLNVSSENVIDVIKGFCPDFVGISANYSLQFPVAIKIAKIIKDYDRNIKIIMGGTHITVSNERILLKKYPDIDFLIKGDGEFAMQKLVSGVDLKKIESLSYRKDNKIISKGITYIEDLDELPFPARHLINLKDYKIHPFEYTNHRNTPFLTSRGCTYTCTTCVAGKYRARKPQNVIDEMKFLYDKGIRDLTIYDACFTLDIKRAESICELMIKEKIKLSWCCETRTDKVNKDLLRKMKRAGCTSILYGIETGSLKNMGRINKKINLNKVHEVINMTKSCGIKVSGSFMIGLPYETIEDINNTVKFAKSLNIDIAWFNIATPLPGTKIWDISGYNSENLEILKKISLYSGDISFWEKKVIEKIFLNAVKSFYFRPRIIKNLLLDSITKGTLKRKFHLFKLLILKNPFLKIKI